MDTITARCIKASFTAVAAQACSVPPLKMRHFIATQAHVYQQDLIGLIYERKLILIDWRAVKRLKQQVLTGEDSYRVYVANEAERASLWYSPSQPLFDSLRADFKLVSKP